MSATQIINSFDVIASAIVKAFQLIFGATSVSVNDNGYATLVVKSNQDSVLFAKKVQSILSGLSGSGKYIEIPFKNRTFQLLKVEENFISAKGNAYVRVTLRAKQDDEKISLAMKALNEGVLASMDIPAVPEVPSVPSVPTEEVVDL